MGHDNLSDRGFTDAAKRIVSHIVDRALDRGMIAGELTEATAGMLALLSILRWERKVGLAVLERIRVDVDRLARELDIAIGEVGQTTTRLGGPHFEVMPNGDRSMVVDMDSPLRTLLELSERQSQKLGHDWVGTEHLLLAGVESACPRLQDLLGSHEIDFVRVRQSILDVLKQGP